MKTVLRAGSIIAFAAASLLGDVTYTKAVKYTGGTMLGFLRNLVGNPLIQRMVGADLEAALEDQSYTVYVKGSKMAQVAESGSTIYDLDANSVTTIDNERQTYSVETFDELRTQIERAGQWMKHPKNEALPFDVNIAKTDQTRMINGRRAAKSLITLTAQSENAWGRPVVNVTTWLVPVDASTRPVYDFAKRAAAKLSLVLTVIPSFFGVSANGLETSATNSERLSGISVLDEIAVRGVTNPLANLFHNRDNHSETPVITLETQSSDFSSGLVDSSKFSVPAGFRQEARQLR